MSHSFAPRSDGQPVVLEHSRAPEKMAADKVRCEACPVLCQISPGKLGACDRYGNVDGTLTRLDTLHLVARPGVDLVAWQAAQDGGVRRSRHVRTPMTRQAPLIEQLSRRWRGCLRAGRDRPQHQQRHEREEDAGSARRSRTFARVT